VKILILKPSSLGDIIQALPVLRLLKLHFPQSQIQWWIDLRFAPLLQDDPDLAGIIPFDRQRWGWPQHWPELYHSIQGIRDEHFDWVIDLQCLMRSGIIAWLANGGLTIGLDDHREGARAFYEIVVPRPSYETHAADWYLEVLRRMNVPVHENFAWLPERPKALADILEKWQPEGKRWLILQPGARWANKRWPVEHFAELVRLLAAREPALHFAILGGNADKALGKAIASVSPERCLDLTGHTTLVEMVEWIRLGELMVTNDTGPMHAAAAMKKPVIGLFGPTNPHRTGPYGQLANTIQLPLPCVPCMKSRCRYEKPMECLRGISPAEVAQKVMAAITQKSLLTRV
jgi:heptosyltransferase I